MSTSDPGGWGPPPGFGQPYGAAPHSYGLPPAPPTGGSARTGPLPLQPMGVGEILDGAVKLYRANFKVIALVALVVSAPLNIAAAVAARGQNGGRGLIDIFNDPSIAPTSTSPFGDITSTLVLVLTSMIDFVVVGPLVAGVVAKAVATSYLGGELTAGQAVRAALGRWWQLIIASLLVHVTELFGLLGCLVGAVFVMALWVVVSPAIVVEELGPLRGMGRSLQLCSGRYWPVLGVALLSGLITSVLENVVAGVPTVAAALIGYRWGFPLIALGGVATSVLVTPISAIVATLLYFDLRIRREGFDLQVMAADMERAGQP